MSQNTGGGNDSKIKYIFRIREICERDGIIPNHYHGQWLPPKARGDNVINPRNPHGYVFSCDGQKIRHISEPPPWLQSNVPFKTYSTYYNAGNFYTINHNAINKKVGDGLREGETDDRDAEHGDTEEEEDGEYECWQNLHFDWNSNFCSSYARMAGAYPRLYAQREDQSWAKMLLPETYHAEPPNWTTDRRYGAFNGDLPLVLSLVAFSFPAAQMSTLFEASFQGSRWRLPTNGPHGRIDKRGIVVDVWPYGSTTIHDLRELEGGVYGPMFY